MFFSFISFAPGTLDAILKMIRYEGLHGFYKGMSTKIVQSVLAAAVLFMIKEELVRGARMLLTKGGTSTRRTRLAWLELCHCVSASIIRLWLRNKKDLRSNSAKVLNWLFGNLFKFNSGNLYHKRRSLMLLALPRIIEKNNAIQISFSYKNMWQLRFKK